MLANFVGGLNREGDDDHVAGLLLWSFGGGSCAVGKSQSNVNQWLYNEERHSMEDGCTDTDDM